MYILNYDPRTGKVSSIQLGNMCIPLCPDNTDYQAFLAWNKAQKKPLDLESTIEPVAPEPVRDLAAEVTALQTQVDEIAKATDATG
jgi:hypothetical protein